MARCSETPLRCAVAKLKSLAMRKPDYERSLEVGLGLGEMFSIIKGLYARLVPHSHNVYEAMLPHTDGDEYTTPFFFLFNEVDECFLCIPRYYEYANQVDFDSLRAIIEDILTSENTEVSVSKGGES